VPGRAGRLPPAQCDVCAGDGATSLGSGDAACLNTAALTLLVSGRHSNAAAAAAAAAASVH